MEMVGGRKITKKVGGGGGAEEEEGYRTNQGP